MQEKIRVTLCLLGAMALLAFGAIAAPSQTALPRTRVAVPDSALSYVPPPGWRTESSSLTPEDNKFCHAAFANGFAANFSIGVRDSAATSDHYLSAATSDHYLSEKAAEIIDDTPTLHIVSRAPFVTTSGLRGGWMGLDVRRPGAPRARRTILYVVTAPHDQKVCVITEALSSDGSKYDAALDACVKTFAVK